MILSRRRMMPGIRINNQPPIKRIAATTGDPSDM